MINLRKLLHCLCPAISSIALANTVLASSVFAGATAVNTTEQASPDTQAEAQLPAASTSNETYFSKHHLSALDERILQERLTQGSAYVMTPHRQNYILVGTYNHSPNQTPFLLQNTYPDVDNPVQHEEVKLQISLKVPLNEDDIFIEGDNLYFGFTLKSFWQLYNSELSAPFRETNYRPEFFYQAPLPWRFMDGEFFGIVGFEHESNGRSQVLSRSWNRAYLGLGYTRDNWALYLQPWYRIPESDKIDDGDPATPPPAEGDDNPDIHKYYGYYEFFAVYKNSESHQLSSKFRFNFNSGKGAMELGYSFPLHHRIKGFVQYFYGYGESMIDYDHIVNRIGFGVLLTDVL